MPSDPLVDCVDWASVASRSIVVACRIRLPPTVRTLVEVAATRDCDSRAVTAAAGSPDVAGTLPDLGGSGAALARRVLSAWRRRTASPVVVILPATETTVVVLALQRYERLKAR